MTFMDFINNNIMPLSIAGGFIFLLIIYFLWVYLKKAKPKAKKKLEKEIVYKDRYLDHDAHLLKDLDKQKFYYEAEGKDFFAKKDTFISRRIDIMGYLNRRMRRKYPDKIVIIRMEMNNGQFRELLVKEDDKAGFKRWGKKYTFDLDARYYVVDSNIWAYDFHESLPLPLKRRIPVNKIKSFLEHSDITEIENMMNPVTLERFVKSEIAQGILQGASIGKLFKIMLILLIVVVMITGIDFIVDLISSGILEQITKKV